MDPMSQEQSKDATTGSLAVKLARAVWREETRAQNLSKEERQEKWQEVKKDRIKMARRMVRRLKDAGVTLVAADAATPE